MPKPGGNRTKSRGNPLSPSHEDTTEGVLVIDITPAQIAAAQANDLDAVNVVFLATDERIVQLAVRNASQAGRVDPHIAEDMAQEGRAAVWEALGRFRGHTTAEFFTYVSEHAGRAMNQLRQRNQRAGVSRAVAERFERCLVWAHADPAEAERLAQSADPKYLGAERMSAETARAARIAWQGAWSLDAEFDGPQGMTAPKGFDNPARHADRLTYADERAEISDEERAARAAKIARVRETLDGLSASHEAVLSAEFGIGDYPAPDLTAHGLLDWASVAANAGVSAAAVEAVEKDARAEFRSQYLGGSPAPDDGPTKVCKTHGGAVPVTDFYVINKTTGARAATCKTCKRSATKRARIANPERRAEVKRRYRANAKGEAAA